MTASENDDRRRLRVVAATPISEELIAEIVAAEPRIDFVRDQSLLKPQRFPGDHSGDPDFRRTPAQQAAFEALVDSADVLYGVPDETPAELARTAAANPGLRWVHTMPAGGGAQVKAAGLPGAALERIAFSTSAGVHAEPLAEYAVFGLLAGAKTLPRLQRQQADRQWSGRWEMGLLSQQTILLVGLGSIGRATASKLQALGATVIGTSRHPDPVTGVDRVIDPDALVDEVGGVDGIVVSLPGTAATEGLVSREVFAKVKPGVTVVSVGRGTVIDQDAMIEALRSGQLGGAYLDVTTPEPLPPESPLWNLPNVVITPHNSAISAGNERRQLEIFCENLRRWGRGEQMLNEVN